MQPLYSHGKRTIQRWLETAVRFCLTLVLLLSGLGPLAPTPALVRAAPAAAPAQQGSNTLQINVMSARTEPNAPNGPVVEGDAIAAYEYIINVDNTGDPTQPRNSGCAANDPGYPDSCDWPSVRAVPGAAPVYTQGDQSDFAGAGLAGLPNGKYLISVMADGYKLGGAHFTVPLNGAVDVWLQPHPLPPATMRIKVFEDVSPVNGQFDAPAEHGLAGFRVTINDIGGEISTDVFGNPLCTTYNGAGEPNGQTNCLVSDANGDIVVPNLGPNRYDVIVNVPNGTNWLETTTLEGSPSWDTWLQEGGTGLDNEFVVAGEPFPWTIFGFVRPTDARPGGAGGIKGDLVSVSVFTPQQGGVPYVGDIWNGFSGNKVLGPITDGWVAISDLQNGDTAIYVGPAAADGKFEIGNLPDGDYLVSWWDEQLHHILDWLQVTVSNGQMVDMGTPFLTSWFTPVSGYVFNDLNSNGVKDAGEPGLANYLVVVRDRDNSEIDRMSIAAITGPDGSYELEKTYPMGSWLVLEAYNDRFYTTGVTYQVVNQDSPTTVMGNGVDVGLLPILGQGGQLDWGVKPYDAAGTQGGPRNGGIVGTVSYDVTRNELDPRYAAVEPWQPGVPDYTVNLYSTIWCGTTGAPCDAEGYYELAPDGSYAKGPLLNSVQTETWEQPTDCTARDVNGNPMPWGSPNQEFLPQNGAGKRCLEAPLTGTQFQDDFATLDGNYGFTEGCFNGDGSPGESTANGDGCITGTLQALPADDYLVEIVSPLDARGLPIYQVTREEDINVFGGDEFIPSVPPPACAGALHTVDVFGVGADGPEAVVNPSFADNGGSIYEGQQKPLCDVKLVPLDNGKSIAPLFTVFTRVPIPGKWKGYIIDDLAISSNPQSMAFGEKAGIPNSPIGIYDFTNRLLTTIQSDPNGVFEVLLPSTYTVSCPSPSGVCPNVYYMLGNDPGQPGALNVNYNPQYRTIGASFEIYSGLIIPSDLAPTQIVPGVLAAGSQFGAPPQCLLNDPNNPTTPEIFALSQPYHDVNGEDIIVTIQGQGFGQHGDGSQVLLDGLFWDNTPTWNDSTIELELSSAVPVGRHQLTIINNNGAQSVNSITFHVIDSSGGSGNTNNPRIYEVGPGRQYATIQDGVNAAAAANLQRPRLVVVYPGTPAQWNPQGAYFENVVINSPIALQGVGPGGVYANGTPVLGSVIDGRGVAGDTGYATDWRNFVLGLTWSGNQAIYEGAVIYVLGRGNQFSANTLPLIDGLTIQGGDQQGFPNNLQPGDPTVKEFAAVQGGGIFVNGYAQTLQISNNVLQSNGGAYGGAIRSGTPHIAGALGDSRNNDMRILHNRILANGGTNLAGAIGMFNGSRRYEIANNDICGNFSAEYGGGISHYGFNPGSSIHHNRIYFNRAYDEGGGVIIAGELPADPGTLTQGAGRVDIYNNLIQNNLANDDGGGLRFLMAGAFRYDVYNNIIVNNISTHEGGGVSLNDATNVKFFNNTVMQNITTATAMTSNGQPAPAGLSTSRNSTLLQATLNANAPIFSNPLLFNNIFWDNRAGTFTGATVAGIGLPGDPNPINYWDLGVAGGIGNLTPQNSVLQVTTGTTPHASNVMADPNVVAPYNTSVTVLPWRGNPRFVDTLMVTTDATPNQLGDYHLNAGSPAIDSGASGRANISAPQSDYDEDVRPQGAGFDMGADEVAPATAFAQFALLDAFAVANRAPLGPNWSNGDVAVEFRVLSDQVQVRPAAGLGSDNVWIADTFGPNQQAFVQFTSIAKATRKRNRQQGLTLKLAGAADPDNPNASAIQVLYSARTGLEVWTKDPAQLWVRQLAVPLAELTLQNGDVLAAQTWADGNVAVLVNGETRAVVNVTTTSTPWPANLAAGGGQIGVTYNYGGGGGFFDNFGGGDIAPVTAASAMPIEWSGPPSPEALAEAALEDVDEADDADFFIFVPVAAK
ncbi:MAG: choice-of-anchor Q domain-containing protein [Caldilineaceae bacterium]